MESLSPTKPDGWLRDSESTARAWLRVDAPTAARFEPHDTRRNGKHRADGDLRSGVSRWRRGVSRRRGLVLLRRYLLLAAAVVLLAAIAIGLAGGDRRTWWLLAPLALALVGTGVAMRRRVTIEQTAQMFDDDLALRNRVATALELLARNGTPSANGDRASAELAARVTGEATAAVSKSFGTVRLRTFGAPLEWIALAGLAAAVALLLALAPGGTAASTTPTGTAGRVPHGNASRTARHGRHAGHGARPRIPPPFSASLPFARARQSGEKVVNPYVPQLTAQQLRQEYLDSVRNQGTRDYLHVVHSSATSPNGVPGQPGLAGPSKSTPSERISSQLAGAGGLGAPTKAPPGDNTPSGAVNPDSPKSGGNAALSKTPGHSAGATGSQRGGGGHSSLGGGEQAGSAPGGLALGQGLAADLPHGSVGLPLQAGYAPSTSKHAQRGEGTSQTPNGGGVGGKAAQSNSTARGSSGFVVIPPSSDATPAGDQTQRDNYFGVANQLPLKSW